MTVVAETTATQAMHAWVIMHGYVPRKWRRRNLASGESGGSKRQNRSQKNQILLVAYCSGFFVR
jgi:hypothetical protein